MAWAARALIYQQKFRGCDFSVSPICCFQIFCQPNDSFLLSQICSLIFTLMATAETGCWQLTLQNQKHSKYQDEQFNLNYPRFSDAQASLALMIVTDWLTDGPKLEIGHFSSLTALSPYVLYSIHVNIMSGQSGHPDQTRPESQITKCICLKLWNVFVPDC